MRRHTTVTALLLGLWLLTFCGCTPQQPERAQKAPASPGVLRAHLYNSGFSLSHDDYNNCYQASNGKLYYVLSVYILGAESLDTGAQMYSLDPSTGKIQHVAELTDAAGEKGLKAIPQGKVHVNFVEFTGKLYFATMNGHYTPPVEHGKRHVLPPPPGYKPYPGGHFLSYDLTTGKFEDIAKAPEGITSMTMDTQRGRLYGLTWPSGLFLRYDLGKRELKNLGPASELSEKGTGRTFGVLCRSLALNPQDGSVYYTTSAGDILRYRYDRDAIEKVEGCSLKKDFFGCLDPNTDTMGYNWRQAVWYAPEGVFYAVHGKSGYLFRFEPRTNRVEIAERIVSEATRKSGMYDQFDYGYLGFTLGPDGHTLYYLTGAPHPTPVEAGEEDLELVTYHIPSRKYIDHGVVELEDGRRPFDAQSIAIGRNGIIYTVAKVKEGGHYRMDLLSFPGPSQTR